MMRAILSIVAVGIIFLGLKLISSAFIATSPPAIQVAPASHVIAAPRQTASPVMLGTALLAGGVVLFILILRRR